MCHHIGFVEHVRVRGHVGAQVAAKRRAICNRVVIHEHEMAAKGAGANTQPWLLCHAACRKTGIRNLCSSQGKSLEHRP